MTESIVLGTDFQTNSNILISQENLESGTYVVGVQGVGKSSLLLDIILQQMEQGESVIVLDPHGDLVRDIVSRMPSSRIQDTYLLDLEEARKFPFGLNIFALPPDKLNSPKARDSVRNQVMHAFEKLWPETRSGLYFGNVLRPVIATLIENQELTLAHVPRLFYNDTFRQHYTKQLKNVEAQEFWGEYAVWSRSKRERYIDPLLDRVKKLLSDDIIRFTLCQKQSKLDLADLIKQRKNILLRLPLRDPAYEYSSPIIGTFFMTLLQAAIFSFGNMPHARRPPCTLVIDEFQNFVTEDNERFFSEGRKYKVKQILAHQYMSQLDRDGLTTMKQAATSAYTIVAFRTNKEDGAALSPLFSGLPRKATDVYIDVLPRLEKHPSPIVKEFYWHTVKPLETAAKLRETTERWTTGEGKYKTKHEDVILPSYNFGFGVVSFEPELVSATLHTLNDALYYSQKEEHINESYLELFWQDFLTLNEAVAYVEVEDSENKQRIQEIDRQIKELKKIARGERLLIPEQVQKITQDAVVSSAKFEKEHHIPEPFNLADDEPLTSLEAKVRRYINGFPFPLPEKCAAIDERLGEISSQLNRFCIERIRKFKTLIEQDGKTEEDWYSVAFKYGITKDYSYPKNFLTENVGLVRRFYVPQHIESSKMYFVELLEYTRLSQEGRLLDLVKSHIDWEERKSRDDASSRMQELEEEKKAISPTRKVENARVLEFKTHIQQVITVLIEQPLTADSSSFSATEIAHTLQQQPNRQAYVKVASTIFQMTTRDLADTFLPVPWQEANERRNTIIKQTKDKYCRGRAQVENEIAAVYQIEEPEEQKETSELSPIPASLTKLQKKSPIGGKSNTQPDLFDRLDADESAT